jgi:hypothetical protein
MTEIGYARQEHRLGPLAIRYTSREAWVFCQGIGHWVPIHLAWKFVQHAMPAGKALALTREGFEAMFPDLPPLPEGAFDTPLDEPSYGHWEHVPIRFTDREAWLCSLRTKRWGPLDTAEVEKGRPLTKRAFERMFHGLPPLPPEAFRP